MIIFCIQRVWYYIFRECGIMYSGSVVFCIQQVWYYVFNKCGIMFSESVVFCIQQVWHFVFREYGILYSTSVAFCIQRGSGLSGMHLNIQSLRPKLDILTIESQPYDRALVEPYCQRRRSSDSQFMPSLQTRYNVCLPYRLDRTSAFPTY